MPTPESVAQRLVVTEHSEVLTAYQEATALAAHNLERAAQDQPPELETCRAVAKRLVAAFEQAPMDCMMLALRPKHGSSFLATHPVNVAIILLELARGDTVVHFPLLELSLIGLLHDVGMASLREIVERPRHLTAEERAAMERHVELTHKLLSRMAGLSPEMLAAATQDHERLDGSGYPTKRRRGEISRLGTLLAVTDIFEAMTHERPHQPARAPYVVLRELLSTGADILEADFLKLLVFRLGVYPIGSWVELSSREVARVVETRPATPLRPLVEIVSDANHGQLAAPRLLDLSSKPGVTIQRWLDEAAVERYLGPPA